MKFPSLLSVFLTLSAGVASAQTQPQPTPSPTPSPLSFQSAREGHVFPDGSGQVTLKIADALQTTGGVVILTDEIGNVLGRVSVPVGAKQVTIPLKTKGYYALRAQVTAAGGQTLTSHTWASVVGPVPNQQERLASKLGIAKIQGSPALLAASGSGWDRGFTPQNGIVRKPNGEIAWWDGYKSAAPTETYNRIEAVMSPPAFTVAPEHQKQQSITVTYPPADWDSYRKVARLFASSRPWVRYFEGINEPDAYHWKGTDEELVEYHRVLRDEVHAVGQGQQVLGPCFWSIDLPHLDKLAKLGFLDAVDGISLHSYPNAPPEGKWIEDIRGLKAYLARNGKPNMPVFLTEYGWGTGNGDTPSPEQELTQARYVARGMTLLAAENLAGSQYFVLRYAAPHDNAWSVTREDNTPRPAYTAIANVFRWLGNAQGRSQWQPTPTSHLILFSKNNRTIAVGWDTQGKSRLTLPLLPSRAESMTGAPLKFANRTVELSQSPIFLQFDTPNLANPTFGKSVTLTRGKTLKLAGSVGQLALPSPLNVQGQSLSAPPDTTPGRYNGLQLIAGKWQIFPIQVKAPWKIANVQIEWPHASPVPVVRFAAHNDAEPVTLQPSLKLDNLPDEFGKNMTLQTNQSASVSLPIQNYLYGTPIRGVARLEQRTPQGISFLSLPFDGLPIVASRREGKDTQLPTLHSAAWRPFGPDAPQRLDAADCSATLQTSYDDNALYLHVAVRDDVPFSGGDNTPLWAADSVQFAFDLRSLQRTESGTKESSALTAKRVLEYVVASRDDKPRTWRFISTLPNLQQNVAEPAVQAQIVRRGDETHYDIQLPWKTLGLSQAPKAGESLAFNLAINDSDGRPADRHGFEITPGIVASKDTSAFATLLFQ